MQLNVSVLKCYFGNLFWTLFYNPDQCALHGKGSVSALDIKEIDLATNSHINLYLNYTTQGSVGPVVH